MQWRLKVFTGVTTGKGEPSWSKKALGDMKRNITKLKECIINYKNINFQNQTLYKTGDGYSLAVLLELYGKDHF